MPAPRPSASRALIELLRVAWPFRARLLLAFVLLLLAKLAFIAVPWALKHIVDSLDANARPEVFPAFALLAYALLRFLGTLFSELRDWVSARVTQQVQADFTVEVFEHLQALDASFHGERHTGSVVRDLERGATSASFLLGATLLAVLPTLIEILIITVVVAAAYSLVFTMALLATFAGYALATGLLIGRRVEMQRRRNDLDSAANARVVDSLLNYETVKAHANERFETARLEGLMTQRRDLGLATQAALTRLHITQSAVIAIGVATIMLLAGQKVFTGSLTVGDLVLLNAYVIQVCLPLNSLGLTFREIRDALVNTEQMFALLDRRPAIPALPDAPALKLSRGEVRFEEVRFAYDAARPVLWDVSFTIPPGGTVAVVGGSGSGKSTLVRLLMRYFDLGGGRILIDGQDLRSVSQASLRNTIGIVPQDTILFNDTLAYNIAYGRPGATQAQIEAAAQAAHVHEFASGLPDRYETRVGERGLKLSGGEKQRIAIARAILRDPAILVLDEATSALDTRSERAIQAALDQVSRDRTTLIIAHRLSTVVDADEILVLDRGRVVERGRHAELLARDGVFAQLWALQQKQSELERREQREAVQPLNLAVLLAAVVDALRQELEQRNITLYTDLDSDSARVNGDPAALQQALWELVAQAADACGAGGRIALRLQRAGVGAQIVVGATASAQPPEIAATPISPMPMDPLRVRSVLEAHRGTFEMQTESAQLPRYTVELPLRAVGGNPHSTSSRVPASDALAGVHVLAVDDNDDAREALQALLGTRGAQVDTAESGRAALERLDALSSAQWPGLLICDISLGEHEDGYEVLRAVRTIEARREVALEARIPAIALTGLSGADARIRALMAGFQLHLVKPVAPDELIAAAAHLAIRRAAHAPS